MVYTQWCRSGRRNKMDQPLNLRFWNFFQVCALASQNRLTNFTVLPPTHSKDINKKCYKKYFLSRTMLIWSVFYYFYEQDISVKSLFRNILINFIFGSFTYVNVWFHILLDSGAKSDVRQFSWTFLSLYHQYVYCMSKEFSGFVQDSALQYLFSKHNSLCSFQMFTPITQKTFAFKWMSYTTIVVKRWIPLAEVVLEKTIQELFRFNPVKRFLSRCAKQRKDPVCKLLLIEIISSGIKFVEKFV